MIQLIKRVPGAKPLKRLIRYTQFVYDYRTFQRRSTRSQLIAQWRERQAFLNDKTANTAFDRHYIYHPAWAARVLARTRPAQHIDISSTLHFCTIVSAFVPVKFYDYRSSYMDMGTPEIYSAALHALPFADNS